MYKIVPRDRSQSAILFIGTTFAKEITDFLEGSSYSLDVDAGCWVISDDDGFGEDVLLEAPMFLVRTGDDVDGYDVKTFNALFLIVD